MGLQVKQENTLSNMKLIGIVTTYNPKCQEFIQNINSYITEIEHLIIWDNTPGGSKELVENLRKTKYTNIELRANGQNDYLAEPFNICIKEAIENGYTHILTMDQDSYFEARGFNEYIEKVASDTDSSVMAFCPAKTENTLIDKDKVEVENSITSGTIYKLEIFEKIGYFREDFLIYMIDIEFSMRIRKNGYKILCYPRLLLNHHTGYAKQNKFGLLINNYSAQSTYYIIRNIILNWRLYPNKISRKEKLFFFKYKIGYRAIKLIFEPDPFKKLKAIYLGVIHGLTGKSGLYNI